MAQPGLPFQGGSETLLELPSIGGYSIYQHRRESDFQDMVRVLCVSEEAPIGMDIRFPDQKKGLQDDGEAPELEDPEYTLKWLSGISMDVVVQIIQEVGEDQIDPKYICQPVLKGVPLPLDRLRKGTDIQEVASPEFQLLGMKSSDIGLYWVSDEEAAPEGPEFALKTEENRPVTDSDISVILHKTMASAHQNHIDSALENLAAIFEKLRNGPPQPSVE